MRKIQVDWHTKPAYEHQRDSILKRYVAYLRNIGLSAETIKLYTGRLGVFLDFAHSDNPSTEIADQFRSSLIESDLSKSHVNNSCFAIKNFYKMNGIEWSFIRLKPNEGIPYYFDEEDVLKIFSVCSNIKHLAMLQTLFYGCLRSSELCKLDDIDLNLETKTLRLRETKSNRDGIAYISDECADTLRTYLKIRPPITIDDRTPLFYTDHANRWHRNDIHRMFVNYKNKANIRKPGGVHVFSRHSPATIMIANGCDIRIVKEVLRHKDIKTTLRYAHVADHTKRERYDEYLKI